MKRNGARAIDEAVAAVIQPDMRHPADDTDHHRLDHVSVNRVAIAASMALPPAASISAPAADADYS